MLGRDREDLPLVVARRALVVAGLAVAGAASAAEPVRVLSAGAVEPALKAALERWRSEGGGEAAVAFATAPRIAERIAAGERPDLVLAPQGLIERLQRAGDLAGMPVIVGSVGVGIAVRAGAPVPAIRDEASLRENLLAAEAVVFNRASTGLYMERLLERMGLAPAIEAKAVRFPDGDGVLRRIASGNGREIAFAAATEIALFRQRGVRFAGPLPDGLQNRTTYAAALLGGGGERNAEAPRILAFLDSAAARAAMAEAGVEQAGRLNP
jgi:molybdate transport system substrate-binding protein